MYRTHLKRMGLFPDLKRSGVLGMRFMGSPLQVRVLPELHLLYHPEADLVSLLNHLAFPLFISICPCIGICYISTLILTLSDLGPNYYIMTYGGLVGRGRG